MESYIGKEIKSLDNDLEFRIEDFIQISKRVRLCIEDISVDFSSGSGKLEIYFLCVEVNKYEGVASNSRWFSFDSLMKVLKESSK